MLAQSFPRVGREFSLCRESGLGEGGKMGFSSLCRGKQGSILSITVSELSSPGGWSHPGGAGVTSWPRLSPTSHFSSLCRLPDPEDWGVGVCCGPLLRWDTSHPQ